MVLHQLLLDVLYLESQIVVKAVKYLELALYCSGYYSRFMVLRQLLLDFLQLTGHGQAGELQPQVLSLGAGHDTTWFQLQACPNYFPSHMNNNPATAERK